MEAARNIIERIIKEIQSSAVDEFAFGDEVEQIKKQKKFELILNNECQNQDPVVQKRVYEEIFSYGPIEAIFNDDSISEIIINSFQSIWVEKKGVLIEHKDVFHSEFTFEKMVLKLCDDIGKVLSLETPVIDGKFQDFRVSIIDKSLTQTSTIINFRRHPKLTWNMVKLIEQNWCEKSKLLDFENLIEKKYNFLIIGATGSGKTSVANALLDLTSQNERSIIIEDTPEIRVSNNCSIKLNTRFDYSRILSEFDQSQLVKSALRLRPDRIVMGEIRSTEAKDFLMALATGHKGSFGTLHASDPHQALIRLEMLVQMGAPQWNVNAIRKLIHLSLDYILVVAKNENHQRIFKGAYKITSLEENGFLLERLF